MQPDDHRHGTHAGAVQHWKDGESACEPCARAHTRARTLRELDPNPRLVPLGQDAWNIINDHPRALLSQQAGIRPARLAALRSAGPTKRVNRTTRARILNATTTYTMIGLQRRLQALQAIGYSSPRLATETGLSERSITNIRTNGSSFTRHAGPVIVAAYQRLHMTPLPPSKSATQSRTWASRSRYAPPFAWGNIDTDRHPKVTEWRRRYDSANTPGHREGDACNRCGIIRQTNESRDNTTYCRDCHDVLRRAS